MPKKNKLFLRGISLLLIGTLLASDLLYASPMEGTVSVPAALNPLELISKDPSSFEAPVSFTSVKDIYKGSGETLILHIQDAHSNLSGQQNLAGALDEIMNKYQVSLVLVEGGTKDDTLTPLKKIAPPEVWKKVAKKFLIEGKISGEEYLNLTSDHPMKIVGIEDKELYMQSLKAYAALAENREKTLGYLKQIEHSLAKLKDRVYPASLLAYEKKGGQTARLGENLKELVLLAQEKNMDLAAFPQVRALKAVQEKEERIDFNLANLEHVALIEKILSRGAAQELKDQLAQRSQMKNDRLAQFSYFRHTLNIANKKNIDLAQYPNFIKYEEYLEGFSQVDLDQLLNETEKLEDKVYAAYLADPDARILRAIDRYTRLLQVAYQIQMTTKEFNFFRANEPDFAATSYLAFVNRKLAEFGYMEDLVPYQDLLESGKDLLGDFYESVGRRDDAFIKNSERILKEERQKVAVLISGGYHTPHLKKLFKDKNYSYVVLAPIVTCETDQQKYEEVLLEPIQKKKKVVDVIHDDSSKDKVSSELEKDLVYLKKKSDGIRSFPLAEKEAAARLGDLTEEALEYLPKSSAGEAREIAAETLLDFNRPELSVAAARLASKPQTNELYDQYESLLSGLEQRIEQLGPDAREKYKKSLEIYRTQIRPIEAEWFGRDDKNQDPDGVLRSRVWTIEHQMRVTLSARLIGEQYVDEKGNPLKEEQKIRLILAAMMHDAGKMLTPARILNYPRKIRRSDLNFTFREPAINVLEEHVQDGVTLLRAFGINEDILRIVNQHHERFNGKGYPFALRGPQIELESRLLELADNLTAIMEPRPYKSQMPYAKALRIVQEDTQKGFHDPQTVKALQSLDVRQVAPIFQSNQKMPRFRLLRDTLFSLGMIAGALILYPILSSPPILALAGLLGILLIHRWGPILGSKIEWLEDPTFGLRLNTALWAFLIAMTIIGPCSFFFTVGALTYIVAGSLSAGVSYLYLGRDVTPMGLYRTSRTVFLDFLKNKNIPADIISKVRETGKFERSGKIPPTLQLKELITESIRRDQNIISLMEKMEDGGTISESDRDELASALQEISDPNIIEKMAAAIEKKQSGSISEAFEVLQDDLMGQLRIGSESASTEAAMISIPMMELNTIGSKLSIPGLGDAFAASLIEKFQNTFHQEIEKMDFYYGGHGSRIIFPKASIDLIRNNLFDILKVAKKEAINQSIENFRKERLKNASWSRRILVRISAFFLRLTLKLYTANLERKIYASHGKLEFNIDLARYPLADLFTGKPDVKKKFVYLFDDTKEERLDPLDYLNSKPLLRELVETVQQTSGHFGEKPPQMEKFLDAAVKVLDDQGNPYVFRDAFMIFRRFVLTGELQTVVNQIRSETQKEKVAQLWLRANQLIEILIDDFYHKLYERLEVLEPEKVSNQELRQAIQKATSKAKTDFPVLGDEEARSTIKNQLRDELLAAYFQALSEGRRKATPTFNFNRQALPRLKHRIDGMKFFGYQLGEIDLQSADLNTPEGQEKLRDVESNLGQFLPAKYEALVLADRDQRIDQMVKMGSVPDVLAADVVGETKNLKDHLERIGKNPSLWNPDGKPENEAKAQELKDKLFSSWELITPGSMVFRRNVGDELGILVRDSEDDYHLIFVEFRSMSDFFKKYPPDKYDSLLSSIFQSFNEIAAQYVGTRKTNWIPQLAAQLNRAVEYNVDDKEKVPLTVKITVDRKVQRMNLFELDSGEGEPIRYAVGKDESGNSRTFKEKTAEDGEKRWEEKTKELSETDLRALGARPIVGYLGLRITYLDQPISDAEITKNPDLVPNLFYRMDVVNGGKQKKMDLSVAEIKLSPAGELLDIQDRSGEVRSRLQAMWPTYVTGDASEIVAGARLATEYSLKAGKLGGIDKSFKTELSGYLEQNGLSIEDAEIVANLLARSGEAYIDLLAQWGVLNSKEASALRNKTDAGLAALQRDVLGDPQFADHMKNILATYESYSGGNKLIFKKRLIPSFVIKQLIDQGFPERAISKAVYSRFEIIVYPDKALQFVSAHQDQVGGSQNAWTIVTNQGLLGAEEFAEKAGSWVAKNQEVLGGPSRAWYIVIGQGLSKADSFLEEAGSWVAKNQDLLGGSAKAWQIVLRQGLSGADDFVEKAGSWVAQNQDQTGGPANAWQIVIAQGLSGADDFLEKATRWVAQNQAQVGGSGKAWQIVIKYGLSGADDFVEKAGSWVAQNQDQVGGPQNAWTIVLGQGLSGADSFVEKAGSWVAKNQDQVGGSWKAWAIVIRQGLAGADDFLEKAKSWVAQNQDQTGGAAKAWQIVIRYGLSGVQDFVEKARNWVAQNQDRVGGSQNAWAIVIGQGLSGADDFVEKAARWVAQNQDQVAGPSRAWTIVIGQGLSGADDFVEKAARWVAQNQDQAGGPSKAWTIMIKQGLSGARLALSKKWAALLLVFAGLGAGITDYFSGSPKVSEKPSLVQETSAPVRAPAPLAWKLESQNKTDLLDKNEKMVRFLDFLNEGSWEDKKFQERAIGMAGDISGEFLDISRELFKTPNEKAVNLPMSRLSKLLAKEGIFALYYGPKNEKIIRLHESNPSGGLETWALGGESITVIFSDFDEREQADFGFLGVVQNAPVALVNTKRIYPIANRVDHLLSLKNPTAEDLAEIGLSASYYYRNSEHFKENQEAFEKMDRVIYKLILAEFSDLKNAPLEKIVERISKSISQNEAMHAFNIAYGVDIENYKKKQEEISSDLGQYATGVGLKWMLTHAALDALNGGPRDHWGERHGVESAKAIDILYSEYAASAEGKKAKAPELKTANNPAARKNFGERLQILTAQLEAFAPQENSALSGFAARGYEKAFGRPAWTIDRGLVKKQSAPESRRKSLSDIEKSFKSKTTQRALTSLISNYEMILSRLLEEEKAGVRGLDGRSRDIYEKWVYQEMADNLSQIFQQDPQAEDEARVLLDQILSRPPPAENLQDLIGSVRTILDRLKARIKPQGARLAGPSGYDPAALASERSATDILLKNLKDPDRYRAVIRNIENESGMNIDAFLVRVFEQLHLESDAAAFERSFADSLPVYAQDFFREIFRFADLAYSESDEPASQEARKFLWKLGAVYADLEDAAGVEKTLKPRPAYPFEGLTSFGPKDQVLDLMIGGMSLGYLKNLRNSDQTGRYIVMDRSYWVEGAVRREIETQRVGGRVEFVRQDVRDLSAYLKDKPGKYWIRLWNVDAYVKDLPAGFYETLLDRAFAVSVEFPSSQSLVSNTGQTPVAPIVMNLFTALQKRGTDGWQTTGGPVEVGEYPGLFNRIVFSSPSAARLAGKEEQRRVIRFLVETENMEAFSRRFSKALEENNIDKAEAELGSAIKILDQEDPTIFVFQAVGDAVLALIQKSPKKALPYFQVFLRKSKLEVADFYKNHVRVPAGRALAQALAAVLQADPEEAKVYLAAAIAESRNWGLETQTLVAESAGKSLVDLFRKDPASAETILRFLADQMRTYDVYFYDRELQFSGTVFKLGLEEFSKNDPQSAKPYFKPLKDSIEQEQVKRSEERASHFPDYFGPALAVLTDQDPEEAEKYILPIISAFKESSRRAEKDYFLNILMPILPAYMRRSPETALPLMEEMMAVEVSRLYNEDARKVIAHAIGLTLASLSVRDKARADAYLRGYLKKINNPELPFASEFSADILASALSEMSEKNTGDPSFYLKNLLRKTRASDPHTREISFKALGEVLPGYLKKHPDQAKGYLKGIFNFLQRSIAEDRILFDKIYGNILSALDEADPAQALPYFENLFTLLKSGPRRPLYARILRLSVNQPYANRVRWAAGNILVKTFPVFAKNHRDKAEVYLKALLESRSLDYPKFSISETLADILPSFTGGEAENTKFYIFMMMNLFFERDMNRREASYIILKNMRDFMRKNYFSEAELEKLNLLISEDLPFKDGLINDLFDLPAEDFIFWYRAFASGVPYDQRLVKEFQGMPREQALFFYKVRLANDVLVDFLERGDAAHESFNQLREKGYYSDGIYNRAITAYAAKKGWASWQDSGIFLTSYGLYEGSEAYKKGEALDLIAPYGQMIRVDTRIVIDPSPADALGYRPARIVAQKEGEQIVQDILLYYERPPLGRDQRPGKKAIPRPVDGFKVWLEKQKSGQEMPPVMFIGSSKNGDKVFYITDRGEILSCCTQYTAFVRDYLDLNPAASLSARKGVQVNLGEVDVFRAFLLNVRDNNYAPNALQGEKGQGISGHTKVLNNRIRQVQTVQKEETPALRVSLIIPKKEEMPAGLSLEHGAFLENTPIASFADVLGYLETYGRVPEISPLPTAELKQPFSRDFGISQRVFQQILKGNLALQYRVNSDSAWQGFSPMEWDEKIKPGTTVRLALTAQAAGARLAGNSFELERKNPEFMQWLAREADPEDVEILRSILSGNEAVLEELVNDYRGKVYTKHEESLHDPDTGYVSVSKGRTVYLDLARPFGEVRVLRIKGARPAFDGRGKLKTYKNPLIRVINVDAAGDLISSAVPELPDGTMPASRALREHDIMAEAEATGKFRTDKALLAGVYKKIFFNGKPAGFMVAGMTGSDKRMAIATLKNSENQGSELSLVGYDERTGHYFRLGDSNALMESMAQEVRKYNDAGFYHWYLGVTNVGIDAQERIVLRDLDAGKTLSEEILGKESRAREIEASLRFREAVRMATNFSSRLKQDPSTRGFVRSVLKGYFAKDFDEAFIDQFYRSAFLLSMGRLTGGLSSELAQKYPLLDRLSPASLGSFWNETYQISGPASGARLASSMDPKELLEYIFKPLDEASKEKLAAIHKEYVVHLEKEHRFDGDSYWAEYGSGAHLIAYHHKNISKVIKVFKNIRIDRLNMLYRLKQGPKIGKGLFVPFIFADGDPTVQNPYFAAINENKLFPVGWDLENKAGYIIQDVAYPVADIIYYLGDRLETASADEKTQIKSVIHLLIREWARLQYRSWSEGLSLEDFTLENSGLTAGGEVLQIDHEYRHHRYEFFQDSYSKGTLYANDAKRVVGNIFEDEKEAQEVLGEGLRPEFFNILWPEDGKPLAMERRAPIFSDPKEKDEFFRSWQKEVVATSGDPTGARLAFESSGRIKTFRVADQREQDNQERIFYDRILMDYLNPRLGLDLSVRRGLEDRERFSEIGRAAGLAWQIDRFGLRDVYVDSLLRERQNYLIPMKLEGEQKKLRVRQELGFDFVPVIVLKFKNTNKMWVLDGHHRTVVASQNGISEIPAYVITLTDYRSWDVSPDEEGRRSSLGASVNRLRSFTEDFLNGLEEAGANRPSGDLQSYADSSGQINLLSDGSELTYFINALYWQDPELTRAILNNFEDLGESSRENILLSIAEYLSANPYRPWDKKGIDFVEALFRLERTPKGKEPFYFEAGRLKEKSRTLKFMDPDTIYVSRNFFDWTTEWGAGRDRESITIPSGVTFRLASGARLAAWEDLAPKLAAHPSQLEELEKVLFRLKVILGRSLRGLIAIDDMDRLSRRFVSVYSGELGAPERGSIPINSAENRIAAITDTLQKLYESEMEPIHKKLLGQLILRPADDITSALPPGIRSEFVIDSWMKDRRLFSDVRTVSEGFELSRPLAERFKERFKDKSSLEEAFRSLVDKTLDSDGTFLVAFSITGAETEAIMENRPGVIPVVREQSAKGLLKVLGSPALSDLELGSAKERLRKFLEKPSGARLADETKQERIGRLIERMRAKQQEINSPDQRAALEQKLSSNKNTAIPLASGKRSGIKVREFSVGPENRPSFNFEFSVTESGPSLIYKGRSYQKEGKEVSDEQDYPLILDFKKISDGEKEISRPFSIYLNSGAVAALIFRLKKEKNGEEYGYTLLIERPKTVDAYNRIIDQVLQNLLKSTQTTISYDKAAFDKIYADAMASIIQVNLKKIEIKPFVPLKPLVIDKDLEEAWLKEKIKFDFQKYLEVLQVQKESIASVPSASNFNIRFFADPADLLSSLDLYFDQALQKDWDPQVSVPVLQNSRTAFDEILPKVTFQFQMQSSPFEKQLHSLAFTLLHLAKEGIGTAEKRKEYYDKLSKLTALYNTRYRLSSGTPALSLPIIFEQLLTPYMDTDIYIAYSNALKNIPEPYRTDVAALDLILMGNHLHYLYSTVTDFADLQVAYSSLQVLLGQTDKLEERHRLAVARFFVAVYSSKSFAYISYTPEFQKIDALLSQYPQIIEWVKYFRAKDGADKSGVSLVGLGYNFFHNLARFHRTSEWSETPMEDILYGYLRYAALLKKLDKPQQELKYDTHFDSIYESALKRLEKRDRDDTTLMREIPSSKKALDGLIKSYLAKLDAGTKNDFTKGLGARLASSGDDFRSIVESSIPEGIQERQKVVEHYVGLASKISEINQKMEETRVLFRGQNFAANISDIDKRNVRDVERKLGVYDVIDTIIASADKLGATKENPLRILDLGAGKGVFLSDIHGQLPEAYKNVVRLTGADPIPLEDSYRRSVEAKGIEWHQGFFEYQERADYPAEGFHLIYATEVLQYAYDPKGFLDRAGLFLADRGQAVIGNSEGLAERIPGYSSIVGRVILNKGIPLVGNDLSGARLADEESPTILKDLFGQAPQEWLLNARDLDEPTVRLLAQIYSTGRIREASGLYTPFQFQEKRTLFRFSEKEGRVYLNLFGEDLSEKGKFVQVGIVELTDALAALKTQAVAFRPEQISEAKQSDAAALEALTLNLRLDRSADKLLTAFAGSITEPVVLRTRIDWQKIQSGDPAALAQWELIKTYKNKIHAQLVNKGKSADLVRFQFMDPQGRVLEIAETDGIQDLEKPKIMYIAGAQQKLLSEAQSLKAGFLAVEEAHQERPENLVPYYSTFVAAILIAGSEKIDESLERFLKALIYPESAGTITATDYQKLREVQSVSDTAFYAKLAIKVIAKLNLNQFLETSRMVLQAIGAAA